MHQKTNRKTYEKWEIILSFSLFYISLEALVYSILYLFVDSNLLIILIYTVVTIVLGIVFYLKLRRHKVETQ